MITLRCTGILLDMDGTLLESNEASESIWQTWARAHQIPIEKIRAVHHGRRPEETISLVAPHLDAQKEAKFIYEDQENCAQGIYPIPGVREFYNALPKSRIGIVTAANQTILEKRFQIVGLTPPPICISAAMLTRGKPDPEGYLLGAKRLGLAASDCVVFEDAPAGLLAAKRAGMPSVAITTHYSVDQLKNELGADYEPILVIENYMGFKVQTPETSELVIEIKTPSLSDARDSASIHKTKF